MGPKVFILALALAFPAAHAGVMPSSIQLDAKAPADPSYDRLVEAANAVVAVKVKALPNAQQQHNASRAHRSGVVIEGGLVLTIGYLILEADQVEVTDLWNDRAGIGGRLRSRQRSTQADHAPQRSRSASAPRRRWRSSIAS